MPATQPSLTFAPPLQLETVVTRSPVVALYEYPWLHTLMVFDCCVMRQCAWEMDMLCNVVLPLQEAKSGHGRHVTPLAGAVGYRLYLPLTQLLHEAAPLIPLVLRLREHGSHRSAPAKL